MNKKIIYIVGCGRSGSTLMGFALGNSTGALDLGEDICFSRFRGCPNGFEADSENYKYWQNIQRNLEVELGPLDFSTLGRMQRAVDHHRNFLQVLLLGSSYRRKIHLPYQRYVKTLYDVILNDPNHDVFITSSKYPSRLQHMLRAFPDHRIHVVHLIRNPIDLAHAFRNKEQGKTKTFWETMLYFFMVNVFSVLATRGLGPKRYVRIHYENFVADPQKELMHIGSAFGIDTSPAIDKINQGLPLDRGYVFNGNRMRMQDQVVFHKHVHKTNNRKAIEMFFEKLFGWLFGGAAANDTRPK